MFTKIKVVKGYIQGLNPSVRESINESVRIMTGYDKLIIAVVRQVAVSKVTEDVSRGGRGCETEEEGGRGNVGTEYSDQERSGERTANTAKPRMVGRRQRVYTLDRSQD